jgi:peptide/nickel transport system ATP-binding protein
MAERTPPLLEVSNLSIDFQTRHGLVRAVRDVNWHIDAGETVAIIGESGSGKSVSTSAVMGLLDMPPGHVRSGRIMYGGEDLLHVRPERRRQINGREIGLIFQDTLAGLNPVYPVGWQVAETLRAHGVGAAEANARALALLEHVGLPNAARRYASYPHEFSGGQRQRIMIAMAIGMRPRLLIADEPTTALDVTVQASILKLLKTLQQESGMGLLMITHDLGVVAQVADRVVVMSEGQVVESGTTAQILRDPGHAYTRKLIDAMPAHRGYRSGGSRTGGRERLFVVDQLSKHYPGRMRWPGDGGAAVERALDGVSFDLHSGETLAVIGESGSGKSTLARTLLKLEKATSGTVHYRGQNITSMPLQGFFKLRREIQMVFQDPSASLNPRMTVEEIISEPWRIHRDVLPRESWSSRVGELLEQVELRPGDARRSPHQFSGGQRQRIAIARALALRPRVVICDEAVSALDVSVRAQVIALLKKLKAEFGLSYLFIAHNLPLVADFADRVLVMHRGRIVEQGETQDIFSRPQHPYTQALLAADPELAAPGRGAPASPGGWVHAPCPADVARASR